jgi:hypothetical protein
MPAKKRDTATAKAKNRRERQVALREQLQAQGHVQHVVDILGKLSDEKTEIEPGMMHRYDLVLKTKLKLIDKFLPTEKPVEVSGDPDNPVDHRHQVEFV